MEDVFKYRLHINKTFNRVWIESSLNCCLFIYIYMLFVCLFTYFISIISWSLKLAWIGRSGVIWLNYRAGGRTVLHHPKYTYSWCGGGCTSRPSARPLLGGWSLIWKHKVWERCLYHTALHTIFVREGSGKLRLPSFSPLQWADMWAIDPIAIFLLSYHYCSRFWRLWYFL